MGILLPRSIWLGPAAVFLLALAVRVLHLMHARGLEASAVLALDSAFYHAQARQVLSGQPAPGDPWFMGPLYPEWLAAVYRVGGAEIAAGQTAQALLAAATATLLFLLGRRWMGNAGGALAAALFTLYGYGLFLDSLLVMAPLLAFLLATAGYASTRAVESRSLRWAAAAGLALGVAASGRGTFLPLAVFVAAAAGLSGRARGRELALATAGVLAALAAYAPTAAHNLSASGGKTLITTNGGINYYIGNHEGADGRFVAVEGVRFFEAGAPEDGGSRAEASRRAGRHLGPVEASHWWLERGLEFNREHPARTAGLWLRKLGLALGDFEVPQIESFAWARDESPVLRLDPIRFGVLSALGLVGAFLLWREHPQARVWLLLGAGHLLLLLPFFVTARHRYPLAAVLATSGAYAVWRAAAVVAAGRWRRTIAPAVATAVLAVAAFAQDVDTARRQGDAHRWYTQGVLAMQSGQLERATELFQRTWEIDPQHLPAAANLGWCLTELGRAQDALAWFERALRLDPAQPALAPHYGRALVEAGRAREAEQLLRSHLEQAPGDLLAQLFYGDTALALGRPEVARRHWQFVAGQSGAPDLAVRAAERLQGLEDSNP